MTDHRHHEILASALLKRPEDYDPWGARKRWAIANKPYPDCSGGCTHFYPLKSRDHEGIGADWGVCANHKSHRCGLLTFEHQGCEKFEAKP